MVTAPRCCHVSASSASSVVVWGLSANVNGAKLCYLGASVNDAELWVHFLKSFH
jgi:hypothetical protein